MLQGIPETGVGAVGRLQQQTGGPGSGNGYQPSSSAKLKAEPLVGQGKELGTQGTG